MKTIYLKEKVRVSDPCYKRKVWCAETLSNVLPGKWFVDIIRYENESTIQELQIRHEDYQTCNIAEFYSEVSADSGQMGVYNEDYFEDNCEDHDYYDTSSWYRRACDLTAGQELYGILDSGQGVVCRSGDGDGAYRLYVAYDNNERIVGIRVDFTDIIDWLDEEHFN